MDFGELPLLIPVGRSVLKAVLRPPEAGRGVIVVANAGASDSYAAPVSHIGQALHGVGFGTLTVNLLSAGEEARDRVAGCHHLDVSFLTDRLCQVLGALRSEPCARRSPVGVFVEGMAAAAVTAIARHPEVGALVCWNGRADLAEDALGGLRIPTLLMADANESHTADLNRKSAALLQSTRTLEILNVPGRGNQRDERVSERAVQWFVSFLPRRTQDREAHVINLNNVLVATDFSEHAQTAVRYGVELARRFEATLHVLHVVDDVAAQHFTTVPDAADLGELQTQLEAEARASLEALVKASDRSATRAQLDIVVSPSTATAIVGYARDHQVDLIVVGTHGRHGIARILMGSVARQVTELAGCPVLTVRAHERDFIHADAGSDAATTQLTADAHQ